MADRRYMVVDWANEFESQIWETALQQRYESGWQFLAAVPISTTHTRAIFFYAPDTVEFG